MVRDAHGDRVTTCRDRGQRVAAAANHEGQRSGPESFGQGLGGSGPFGSEGARLVERGHVHDERVVGRSALGRVDARDRCAVVGACGEAVDGLGRHGDQAASAQDRGRSLDGVAVVGRIGTDRKHGHVAHSS